MRCIHVVTPWIWWWAAEIFMGILTKYEFNCNICNEKEIEDIYLFWGEYQMSHLMTKPTKWKVRPAKTQISLSIRPVWSESSLSAWRKLGFLATHWAQSEDSDQTGRMPKLFWVIAGRTCRFVGFIMRWLKYISSNVLKISAFSRVRIDDIFNTWDEIFLVFTEKKFFFSFYFIPFRTITESRPL